MSPVYWPLFCESTFSWGPCSRTIKKRICGHNTALQWVQIALAIKQKGLIHKRNSLGNFAYSKRGKKKKNLEELCTVRVCICAHTHVMGFSSYKVCMISSLGDWNAQKISQISEDIRVWGQKCEVPFWGLKKETHRKIRLWKGCVFAVRSLTKVYWVPLVC